jgi:hypothetical protein
MSVGSTKSDTASTERLPQELSAVSLLVLISPILSCTLASSFHAPWAEFDVVDPWDAATVHLPETVGQVCLSTVRASSRDDIADVVLAFQTLSGYCLDRWFHRLRRGGGLRRDWRSNPRRVPHQDYFQGDVDPGTYLVLGNYRTML